MLVAIAYYREPAKDAGGNKKKSCETRGFECGGLSRARTIVNPAPDLFTMRRLYIVRTAGRRM